MQEFADRKVLEVLIPVMWPPTTTQGLLWLPQQHLTTTVMSPSKFSTLTTFALHYCHLYILPLPSPTLILSFSHLEI